MTKFQSRIGKLEQMQRQLLDAEIDAVNDQWFDMLSDQELAEMCGDDPQLDAMTNEELATLETQLRRQQTLRDKHQELAERREAIAERRQHAPQGDETKCKV